jgi:hypothetical protein
MTDNHLRPEPPLGKASVPSLMKDLAFLAVMPLATILATRLLHMSADVLALLLIFLIAAVAILWRYNQHVNRLLRRQMSFGTMLLGLLVVTAVLMLVLPPRKQAWTKWQQDLSTQASDCQGDARNQCLAQVVAREENMEPISTDSEPVSSLIRDLTAGHIIEDTQPFKDALRDHLGIDGQYFVGAGFSLPVPASDSNDPLLPEYLVPNYPESNSQVWIWAVDPGEVASNTLKNVLFSEQPLITRSQLFSEYFKRRIASHLDPGDQTPAVVRFALIDPNKYSHCLGKTSRNRVFVSPLDLSLDSTVQDAANYSGYLPGDGENKKLYIFVFQPTRTDEVIRATWSNLMRSMNELLTEPDPCAHG